MGQVIARICDSYHRTEPVKPATSAIASVIRFLSPILFLAGPHVPIVPCTQQIQTPIHSPTATDVREVAASPALCSTLGAYYAAITVLEIYR